MVLRLDELNVLRSQPFDEYFGVMNISRERILRRIGLADSLETLLLTVMNTISLMLDYGSVNWDFIGDMLTDGLEKAVFADIEKNDAAKEMIAEYVKGFRETTKKVEEPEFPVWLLSADRARYNAENEANNYINYAELQEAIAKGFTQKTWHTEMDDRVRPTHVPLEGETIGIHEYFHVGKSYMRYPKELATAINPDPQEVVNCRCSLSFS